MIEGSGSIPLTSGSGSGSGRPKNMWIRIRNTGLEYSALRGMARPVSSRSPAGILSRPGSCLGRVASRMSPVFGFEALNIHTALYLPGEIILFFIHKNTKKFFHRSSLCGRNLDILRVRVCKFWDWDAKRWYWKRMNFEKKKYYLITGENGKGSPYYWFTIVHSRSK